ncbi:MAG: patatin-like phospholipase family protein [Clostridiales bacterium]|nr:patatin-like phospholipase family protein [Clostridiales bacterium]
MSKKIGLALGSGGARGVAHLGVIKALEEEGIRPDYITGCSMGSVVGAGYANGLSIEEMYKIVKKLKPLQLIDVTALPITRLALTRGNKMRNLLVSSLGNVTFDELKIPFKCVASDLYSGRLVTLSEGKVATAVAASSSMPTIFPPVKLHGQLLIDGGVLCRVPTRQCKEMGADKVIAVDVLDNTKEPVKEVKNIISMIMRIFDMMDYNGSEMKKELCGTENELWLVPEMKGLSQYAVKDADRAYEEGYLTTKARMSEIKEFVNN